MSKRAIVILAVLAVLAMGAGVAGGVVFAHRGAKPLAADTPAGPAATATTGSEPPTSASPTTGSSTSTSAGLAVRAAVAQRFEDGLLIRWQASAPVTAVLTWGFGAPSGHQVPIPGTADHGTVTLALARTTRPVTFQVSGRTADGRSGSSPAVTGQRVVRRAVLTVSTLQLDIPQGTAGLSTGFLGTTYTFGPGLAGPVAAAQPYSFPAEVLTIGVDRAPLALRFFHRVPPDPQRSAPARVAVDFPEPGRTVTLTRTASAVGVTAHLTLKVTVSIS
jgi:hypothetical protein